MAKSFFVGIDHVKTFIFAVAIAAVLTSQARADDPELSPDTKRMLAYGTLAVMTGVCKTDLTAEQSTQMKTGLQQAADAQKEMTPDQFTDMMKTVGAQVGQNKEQVCASLTPDFIDTSLKQAAAGE